MISYVCERNTARPWRRSSSGPPSPGVNWADIESLFAACGAYIEEREGSRVYVELNDVAGHFHRPHPEKETRKGAVESVRRFLKEAAIEP